MSGTEAVQEGAVESTPAAAPAWSLDLLAFRLEFVARDSVYFPPGKAGNIVRGAFGAIFRQLVCAPQCHDARTCEQRATCAYARIFEPVASAEGPSGLHDWPRPFVFRAAHLDGETIEPGKPFFFDVHLFDLRDPAIVYFVLAFAQVATEGLGPRRGRAALVRARQLNERGRPEALIYDGHSFVTSELPPPIHLDLSPPAEQVARIRLRFVTPTELKHGQLLATRPEFPILFGRIRDRLSTLRALYGAGALELDFRAVGERAAQVKMTRCELRFSEAERRSAKTGERHPLGGFVGEVEYEGPLTEFMPYLYAAKWVGVGRQTVWGKGVVELDILG
ncbi:MAG: CRISPR system precrRNA processing endoribonuclease RAMP protein Cas6 [Bryobacteraceae bacterium]